MWRQARAIAADEDLPLNAVQASLASGPATPAFQISTHSAGRYLLALLQRLVASGFEDWLDNQHSHIHIYLYARGVPTARQVLMHQIPTVGMDNAPENVLASADAEEFGKIVGQYFDEARRYDGIPYTATNVERVHSLAARYHDWERVNAGQMGVSHNRARTWFRAWIGYISNHITTAVESIRITVDPLQPPNRALEGQAAVDAMIANVDYWVNRIEEFRTAYSGGPGGRTLEFLQADMTSEGNIHPSFNAADWATYQNQHYRSALTSPE